MPENPPSFSCYRDKSHTTEGIVTYSGCQVVTDFMDARSGVFTVKRGGIYRQVRVYVCALVVTLQAEASGSGLLFGDIFPNTYLTLLGSLRILSFPAHIHFTLYSNDVPQPPPAKYFNNLSTKGRFMTRYPTLY